MFRVLTSWGGSYTRRGQMRVLHVGGDAAAAACACLAAGIAVLNTREALLGH